MGNEELEREAVANLISILLTIGASGLLVCFVATVSLLLEDFIDSVAAKLKKLKENHHGK